jgi:cation transport regulator
MPYGGIEELPSSVRSVLPKHAQEIFVAAFNSAHEDTCKDRKDREACANSIAWSAVKNEYQKGDDDNWHLIKKQKCCRNGECIHLQQAEAHDAIIHLLNRYVNGEFFPVDVFEKSIEDWNGVPIIFSDMKPTKSNGNVKSDHPDFEAFDTTIQDSEIQRVNGAIVGEIRKARIEKEGHPRFMGQLVFTPSTAKEMFDSGLISQETFDKTEAAIEKARALNDDGILSGSTGFTCKTVEGDLKGKVVPNHLLVFEEDAKNQPADRGTVILNKGTDTFVNEGRVISGINWNTLSDIKKAFLSFMDEIESKMTKKQKDAETPADVKTNQPGVQGSQEEKRGIIQKALNARFGRSSDIETGEKWGCWIVATFDNLVIFEGLENKTYEIPYTLTDTGELTLGEPAEVEITYVKKQKEEQMPTQEELDAKDAEIKKLTDENAAMKAELEKMRADMEAMKTSQEQDQKKQKDAEWATLKAKLPKGLIHTPEDEQKSRDEFESNPGAFMNKLLDVPVGEAGKENGEKFTNKDPDAKKQAEADAILKNRSGHRIPGRLH